jgi:hypothetical protein
MTIYGFYNWRRGNYHPAQLSQPKDVSTPIYQIEADTNPHTIPLGNINDPWGEIARYQKTEMDSYEEIQVNEKTLIGFSSWFQQAPNLAQSGAQMMLNSYTLTFKPEIAKGIADGSFNMMKSLDGGIHAIAVDGKHVIQGAGSLNPATGLKSIASVMAVWQVLAAVTAQKFLADINKQLVKINKDLDGIKNFLENQQYSVLIGNLEYIRGIQDTLNSQSFNNVEFGAFLNQLEDIERECTQIMRALESRMAIVYDNLEKQPLGAILNVQDNFIKLKELIIDNERISRSYLIAVAVKGLASQTRCAIPSNRYLALTRLSTLQTELSAWNENQQKFFQLVGKRLPKLTNWFDGGEDERRQLKEEKDRSRDSLTEMDKYIQKLVLETKNNVRNQIQEISQPLTLLVQLNEDGQIIKTWKLHNENNKAVEISEKEIGISEEVIEEVPREKELAYHEERKEHNDFCPVCGLPFKTLELVQEHRERWEH